MIKILFVISNLSGGGAEHVARKNIEIFLNNDNYKVAVITNDLHWGNNLNIKKYITKDFRLSNNKIEKIRDTLGVRDNYKIMSECLKEFNPNIIHIHDYIPFTHTLLKALKEHKSKHSCKVILTHHTYNFVCTNDSLYDYNKNRICEKCIGKFDHTIICNKCTGKYSTSIAKYLQKKMVNKQLNDLIDVHIAPSEFMKNVLLKRNNDLNIEVIYNPCLDKLNKNINGNKADKIVFFGRVNIEKNIENFARIFSNNIFNKNLVIIGTGNSSEAIKKIIEKNYNENITFIHKFLNTEDLYNMIKDARYFVLPSIWYENSPVSIVEAINWGLIPITSNIGGMKELIEYFNYGHYFDPRDESSIINCIKNLDNHYNADSMKKENIQNKLKVFLVDNYKIKIEELYCSYC